MHIRIRHLALLCAAALALTACGGGTKLVKKPPPLPQREQPLAVAADANLHASLDWVIVRNGPGAWAKNADWDEYLLRVKNVSAAPVRIDAVIATDSTGHDAATLADRKQLVQASKATAKRYRQSGVTIAAGRGGGALVAIGAGVAHVGYGLGSAAAAGLGSSAVAAGALTMLVAGPVFAGMGIARAINNGKVADRIDTRATTLPLTVAAGAEANLDAFFPLSPSPQRVTIRYSDAQGDHQLEIDTRQVLAGLHLPAPAAK